MEIVKQIFVNGGWVLVLYVVYRVAFWIIRKTTTTTDDAILDNYVSKAVKFALTIIPNPDTTQINWLKFVGNALAKFNEAYTKEQGDSPDATTFEKAKKIIEEIADNSEFKNVKVLLEQYKDDKTVA